MRPQRHEELGLTADGIVLGQLAQVLGEAFSKDNWESRGVFGYVGGGSVGFRAVDIDKAAVVSYVRRFGSAVTEQDEADLRAWWSANGTRVQGQWKAHADTMGKDAALVVADFVQDLVSDSHYTTMSVARQMLKSFNLEKACALHRRYWTDVIHMMQKPTVDVTKYHEPNHDLMSAHEVDSRLPTPRAVTRH